MARLPRTITAELNVVVSGNKRSEAQVRAALVTAGFALVSFPDPEPGKQPKDPTFGLPSYTDPIEAAKAGKPNAGHTPNTPHPSMLRWLVMEGDHEGCTLDADGSPLPCEHVGSTEWRGHDSPHVGEPYEPDQQICFVGATIEHAANDSEAQGAEASKAHATVAPFGWQLRQHWETQATPEKVADPMEARIAALELALGTRS